MVPMVDLKKQFQEIKDEINHAVRKVIESGHYILGPHVADLEQRLAHYHGVREAIGVASCTDALHLSIAALGIEQGDEIITTPFTFFATVEAILYAGATPVFVDIEPDTFNINTHEIETQITKRTKAILPVHLFGHPAGMNKIMQIAKKHRLLLIEDCAQSICAHTHGKKAGSFGDAGCFSFYPSKNLGAYGDGGMIILNNSRLAKKIRILRNHGSPCSYKHDTVGFNSRLDELQAAILLVKFKRLEGYTKKRRQHAALYSHLLSGTVVCPLEREGSYHVFHQYTIRSPRRDAIQKRLKENGIASVIYYPVPLHLQKALRFLGYHRGDFPVTEKAAQEVLSLPMYPELEASTIQKIADVIHDVV
jgi:UDP-2-acetamido-2-deoxy-ribo-hexuluronate aminotransferase